MKKILVLLLALCLISSLCLIAGCGEKNPDEGKTSKSVVTSDESTSSFSRPSRVTTRSEQPGTSTNTSKPPVFSTEYSAGGETSTSVPGVVPSGESLIIPETPIPSGISTNAKIMMMTINGIKSVSPTNFREKKDLLDSIDTEYAKLTAAEKQEVANYNHFLAAKEKYVELNGKAILIEWEELIGRTIPEANLLKNADVENVNKANDMHGEYASSLQTIENYATYKAKLDACLARIKANTVEVAFIAQDLNGNGVLESAVLDSSGKTRNEINGEKKRSVAPTFFTFASFSVHGSAGSNNTTYSDLKNSNVTLFQYAKVDPSITFTADAPGTVEYYPRKDQSRSYTVTQNGETIAKFTSSDSPAIFKVNSGLVTLMVDGTSEGGCIAIKFSYPNLG